MSYNDISDMFGEYTKSNSKNCQHLKELFEQAIVQMIDEGEIEVQEIIIKNKQVKN